MNYHPQDFEALSNAVEDEGGALCADECTGHTFRLKMPDGKGKKEWQRWRTTHCDEAALMEIPYDPTLHVRIHDDDDDTLIIVDHKGEKPKMKQVSKPVPYGMPTTDAEPVPSMVKVCAVDDAVGLWPRYSSIVSNRSYQS